MQRLLYSTLSLLIMLGLLVFALPIFLIFAAFIVVFLLIGALSGRTSFTVYRQNNSRPPSPPSPGESPRRPIDKGVIDITEDQEGK